MSIRIPMIEAQIAAGRLAARSLAIAAAGALALAAFTAPASADQREWVKQSFAGHTKPSGDAPAESPAAGAAAEAHPVAPGRGFPLRPGGGVVGGGGGGYQETSPIEQPGVYHRCQAIAQGIRGGLFRATSAIADRPSESGACEVALAACEARLERKRLFDKRGYPNARCQIANTQRIAVGTEGYGDLGRNSGAPY